MTNIEPPDNERMKRCPYCAEMIQSQAIICRFCNQDLRSDTIDNPMHKQEIRASVPSGQSLSAGDIIVALVLPIIGLIVAIVYLTKEQSRSRGYSLMAVSIIAWIVWWFICTLSGGF